MSELLNYLNAESPLTLDEKIANGDEVTVYKLDSKGKQRQWSIWVAHYSKGDPVFARINIETGLVEGKKVTQTIDIDEGKNLGKANATTPFTQAIAEAQAKLEQQLRSGYVENLADVKASGTLGSGIQSPMLAQKYHPTGEQKGSKTLEKMKIKGKKIHVQPKLDGNRCLIKLSASDGKNFTEREVSMYTRKGDLMPVQLYHILDEVLVNFNKTHTVSDQETYGNMELILDGELFSDEMPFNELNGHLKRKDNQDLEQLAKIKYHLYDIFLGEPYSVRYKALKDFASEHVEIVPSYEIIATDENIKEKLEEFLAEGHEGLMIRTLDTPYENKRSWQLVKVKLFEDFETEILDLEEDAMGRLGFLIMKMPKPVLDRDGKLVTTFKAGLSGVNHEDGVKMLKEKHKYIGKQATVEHFGWDVRPRFPKFKGVRED